MEQTPKQDVQKDFNREFEKKNSGFEPTAS